MAGIKRTPADIAFSQCIRERSDWTCERCGTKYERGARGLECSHYHTRGKWGVRFHSLNAEALCTGCHFLEGGLKRADIQLTEFELDVLTDLVNDTGLGKEIRKTKGKGAIAKHFREQLQIMQDKRAAGAQGRLEFEDYV